MATVKFFISKKSGLASIYLRFSIERGKVFRKKSGYSIQANQWNSRLGLPKRSGDVNGSLTESLLKLETFVVGQCPKDQSNGISTGWLERAIQDYHGSRGQLSLTEYYESFLERLRYSENRRGETVQESTIRKYRTILIKLRSFEKFHSRELQVGNVDLYFRDEFVEYLHKVERLSQNTVGRYLKFVKTVVLDAKARGMEVSSQIDIFRGYTVKAPKVILTFDELDLIEALNLGEQSRLEIARDWLIIGCFTGQRISDLLRMNRQSIVLEDGYSFIRVIQKKTQKTVFIPIHSQVSAILEKRGGEFPPLFTKSWDSNFVLLNRYVKLVCKIADLNSLHKGKVWNPDSRRFIIGEYPKWQLVSSHVCRRSFATNFYAMEAYSTPLLMNITGHSSEKMFLEYIVEKTNSLSLELARRWSE